MCSGRTWSWKQILWAIGVERPCGPPGGGPHGSFSELELGDVLLVEQERGPEHDLGAACALDDLVRAELAGLERLADLALDVARGDRRRGVGREVAEVLGVPEREVLERVVQQVLLHLA